MACSERQCRNSFVGERTAGTPVSEVIRAITHNPRGLEPVLLWIVYICKRSRDGDLGRRHRVLWLRAGEDVPGDRKANAAS